MRTRAGFGLRGIFSFLARMLHGLFMAVWHRFRYDWSMETLIERLVRIGIEPEVIKAIQADGEAGRETALLLLAQYEDEHEYLD